MPRVHKTLRRVAVVTVLAGGMALFLSPGRAPWLVAAGLVLALVPVRRAWVAARGTALRASVGWATIALGLGVVSQVVAAAEPLASGRTVAGHWTYLTTLALLAALISVLNARTPGGGAWAILMALLVLVFLIPWLEGPGLRRVVSGTGPLRLDSPWTLFYALLVLAGVTNYLPTRYALAAVVLGLGFGLEYVGLTRDITSPARRAMLWSALPWCLAASAWLADWRAGAPSAARGGWRTSGSGSATTGAWSGRCVSRSGSTARRKARVGPSESRGTAWSPCPGGGGT
jgi:hypothetical protein